jgi:hypothetical protein
MAGKVLEKRLEKTEHMLQIAREALVNIRDNQGRVCQMFEICTHESCRSSHASWEIADKALKDLEGSEGKMKCRLCGTFFVPRPGKQDARLQAARVLEKKLEEAESENRKLVALVNTLDCFIEQAARYLHEPTFGWTTDPDATAEQVLESWDTRVQAVVRNYPEAVREYMARHRRGPEGKVLCKLCNQWYVPRPGKQDLHLRACESCQEIWSD